MKIFRLRANAFWVYSSCSNRPAGTHVPIRSSQQAPRFRVRGVLTPRRYPSALTAGSLVRFADRTLINTGF